MLETFGELLELVVGAFGEVSSDMDRVISSQVPQPTPKSVGESD